MHCVDTGHDTWGDQDKEERKEGGEVDEVHNWEGYKAKFLMSFIDGQTILVNNKKYRLWFT